MTEGNGRTETVAVLLDSVTALQRFLLSQAEAFGALVVRADTWRTYDDDFGSLLRGYFQAESR